MRVVYTGEKPVQHAVVGAFLRGVPTWVDDPGKIPPGLGIEEWVEGMPAEVGGPVVLKLQGRPEALEGLPAALARLRQMYPTCPLHVAGLPFFGAFARFHVASVAAVSDKAAYRVVDIRGPRATYFLQPAHLAKHGAARMVSAALGEINPADSVVDYRADAGSHVVVVRGKLDGTAALAARLKAILGDDYREVADIDHSTESAELIRTARACILMGAGAFVWVARLAGTPCLLLTQGPVQAASHEAAKALGADVRSGDLAAALAGDPDHIAASLLSSFAPEPRHVPRVETRPAYPVITRRRRSRDESADVGEGSGDPVSETDSEGSAVDPDPVP